LKRSTAQPKPINIRPELADRRDGPDQFEKFDRLFRNVISVPKAEIDKQEAKWKRKQAKKHGG
jgi:hypothetical protein